MSERIRNNRIEYLVYFFFWGVLVLAPFSVNIPLFGMNEPVVWKHVFSFWLFLLPVFVLFLLNNYILLPYLFIHKKYKWLYFLLVLLIICINGFLSDKYIVSFRPERPGVINKLNRPDYTEFKAEHPPFENGPIRKVSGKYSTTHSSIHDTIAKNKDYYIGKLPRSKPPEIGFVDFLFNPLVLQIFIILMALILNGFTKLYFVAIRDEKLLKEFERQKLVSELEYLKCQINPHFLMNTLNNIHALIGIDKQKAQMSVLYLSKMLRYMLYESSSNWAYLDKEVDFLKGYINLMRLRCNENVKIKTNLPLFASECELPSMLLISFVENAFKHGIKQQGETLIDISITINEGKLIFVCRNTIGDRTEPSLEEDVHGIGLENTRKRLSLLYGDRYVLDISSDDVYYNVLLKIPLDYDEVYYHR